MANSRFTPNYRWSNWMGNLTSTMDLYEPNNVPELKDAVVRATNAGGKIRPVGGSCAWSPLVPTFGSIISMRNLREMPTLDRSGPKPTVTVQTGWPIKQLVDWTRAQGLTLISPTIFQEISVGGALAVGAHGTGLGWSTMSDSIVNMKLITLDGYERVWSATDGDLFRAAQVGLGAFGLVHEVTLEVEPEFYLQVDDSLVPRHEVLDNLDDILATYDFVELYWFPFNELMWVKGMRRTPEPPPKHPWRTRLHDKINELIILAGAKVLPWLAKLAPRATPLFMQLAPWMEMTPGSRVEAASEEFHYQQAYPRCWDMSWAVPLADSKQVWSDTMVLIEDFARQGKYPVNMCVHSRFVGASQAWLSPAYNRPVCDIEVCSIKGTPNIYEFFDAWTAQMLANADARPHWGKLIRQGDQLKQRYDRVNDWLALRTTLDPSNLLLNDFLAREVFQIP